MKQEVVSFKRNLDLQWFHDRDYSCLEIMGNFKLKNEEALMK